MSAGRCRCAPTRALHDRARSPRWSASYDAVNIKLDKAGGLTEALAMAQEAERLGFSVMIGCMVATSLAMAPAMLVAQRARYRRSRRTAAARRATGRTALLYEGSSVHPPTPALWG